MKGVDAVLAERLVAIAARHAVVGDIRSLGLYGVLELVRDRETREPLPVTSFTRVTRFNYVFVAPPLTIDEGDLAWGLDGIDALLGELCPSRA